MEAQLNTKRILIFLAIACGVPLTASLAIYLTVRTEDLIRVAAIAGIFLGITPALANVASRLITREGWKDLWLRPNFRRTASGRGGWRFYLAAWLLPLLATIVGGGIFFLLFPQSFDSSLGQVRNTFASSPLLAANPWAGVLVTALKSMVIGPILGVIYFGEEFGWRAYLLPKLMPVGSRKAVLLVGVIWSAWHWPMILMGFNYGTGYWGAPFSALPLFTLIILAPSIMYSWMALRSGSVWPACIAHAENNLFTYLMVLFLVGKPDVLIGPSNEGIVGGLGYVLLTLPVFLIPAALAPVVKTISEKPAAVEKAADQASLETVS
jgi:membrane protease YdiL (CAAX protease family)